MNVEVTTTEPDFPGRIEVTGIPDYDPKKKDLHINFRWSEAYRGVGPAYLNGKRSDSVASYSPRLVVREEFKSH
jgi:hypothetical protein